jgi:uncharacterized membrane protein YdjX (TVP38/TMEM64 family)
MSPLPPEKRKKLLFKLGLAGAIAAAIALFLLKGVHILDVIDRVVALASGLGPWVFFTAMALLPAFGAPTLAFTLIAGSAFGTRMGMSAVVMAGMAATAVNLAITYWLARGILRKWVALLLERLGYKMPEVDRADITDLIVILRVTTGIPFFVQNYFLGLADAPVARYLIVSCILTLPQSAAFIVFGSALRHGRGGAIVAGLGVIIALAAATQLLRRHFGRRKAAA